MAYCLHATLSKDPFGVLAGFIGALATILASILIPAPKKLVDPSEKIGELKTGLAAVRGELTAIRELLTVDEQRG